MNDYTMRVAKKGENVYVLDKSTNKATETSLVMLCEDDISTDDTIFTAFSAMDPEIYDDLHNKINIESDRPILLITNAIEYIKYLTSDKIYPISINTFDSQIEINDIDNDGIDIRYRNEPKIYDHMLRMTSETFVKELKNFMNYLRINELLDDEEDIKYAAYIFVFNLFDNHEIIDENTIDNVFQDIINLYF